MHRFELAWFIRWIDFMKLPHKNNIAETNIRYIQVFYLIYLTQENDERGVISLPVIGEAEN